MWWFQIETFENSGKKEREDDRFKIKISKCHEWVFQERCGCPNQIKNDSKFRRKLHCTATRRRFSEKRRKASKPATLFTKASQKECRQSSVQSSVTAVCLSKSFSQFWQSRSEGHEAAHIFCFLALFAVPFFSTLCCWFKLFYLSLKVVCWLNYYYYCCFAVVAASQRWYYDNVVWQRLYCLTSSFA